MVCQKLWPRLSYRWFVQALKNQTVIPRCSSLLAASAGA